MAPKIPKRIGRYKILGELGRGAMGVVYKAEDPALDRVVALKTISLAEAEGRKDYEKRFMLEAKAAGKLTHPNIVTIFDFGEEDDLAYMAMELLEGTELRARMRQGAIPAAEAVDIALQVAEGLAFAHEHGVVHRDVKPGNIMLLERGPVKIMDFGIARMRHADHKTSTGMVLGTPRCTRCSRAGRCSPGATSSRSRTTCTTSSTRRPRARTPTCRRCSTSSWRAR
jgi:serine/threonine-protein kinase